MADSGQCGVYPILNFDSSKVNYNFRAKGVELIAAFEQGSSSTKCYIGTSYCTQPRKLFEKFPNKTRCQHMNITNKMQKCKVSSFFNNRMPSLEAGPICIVRMLVNFAQLKQAMSANFMPFQTQDDTLDAFIGSWTNARSWHVY